MRIYQMVTFPLRGCGSGVYADKLSHALLEMGHSINMLCADHYPPSQPYPTQSILFNNGVNPSYDLPFNFPCFTTHPLSPTTTFGSLNESERRALIQTMRIKIKAELQSAKPDLAHVHHGWVMGALVAETRVPYVVSLHGTEHYGFSKYPAYRSLALAAIQNARAVMALTEKEKADAVATYHIPATRVTVIPNGIDTRVFQPLAVDKHAVLDNYRIPRAYHNQPIVFFASKLAPHKGLDILLRAARIYSELEEKPITLIAGDGDVRGAMELMAHVLKLERVYFIGNQNQTEMVALYNIADVCVLPSTLDYFPLAPLEALACGTPVIASDVGGLRQIVNARVGWLVPPGDRAELADKISIAIRSRGKAAMWQDARAHILARYSLEQIAKRIVNVYETALGASKSRHAAVAAPIG